MFDIYNSDILEKLGVPDTYFKNKTVEYKYWFRSLLQKIDSSLIFKGLPEDWPEDFFKFCLWARGYVAVFNTERWGTTFQPASSISGYDFYYQPRQVVISNPYYNKTHEIHKDAELIKLTPDFHGVLDIIDHYATRLAELSKSVLMQFISAKCAMVMWPRTKAEAELLASIYDAIQSGQTYVAAKPPISNGELIPHKDAFGFWNQDFKQTYIAKDLLDNLQCVLDNFYMEIGLPTTLDKRSHTLNEEMNFQQAQSQARIACWVANLNESFERIERLFGLKLEVEYAQNNDTDTDGADTERFGE